MRVEVKAFPKDGGKPDEYSIGESYLGRLLNAVLTYFGVGPLFLLTKYERAELRRVDE